MVREPSYSSLLIRVLQSDSEVEFNESFILFSINFSVIVFSFQYVPETPSYLLYTNQEARAEKSLQWLRGPEADISSEMATIHSNIRRMRDQGTSCRNVLVPQLLKPLLITCGLMFFQR
jgi:hypothetical protein